MQVIFLILAQRNCLLSFRKKSADADEFSIIEKYQGNSINYFPTDSKLDYSSRISGYVPLFWDSICRVSHVFLSISFYFEVIDFEKFLDPQMGGMVSRPTVI